MFKFNCPYCRQPIEAEDEWIGQVAECPNCGQSIEIKRPTLTLGPQLRKASGVPSHNFSQHTQPPPKTSGICFWLGFLLWLFGLLIAAIIEGKEGAIKALMGMLWSIIVGVVIWIIFGVMMHFA
jgi:hypothetical protein